jgi:hypothetical protein
VITDLATFSAQITLLRVSMLRVRRRSDSAWAELGALSGDATGVLLMMGGPLAGP